MKQPIFGSSRATGNPLLSAPAASSSSSSSASAERSARSRLSRSAWRAAPARATRAAALASALAPSSPHTSGRASESESTAAPLVEQAVAVNLNMNMQHSPASHMAAQAELEALPLLTLTALIPDSSSAAREFTETCGPESDSAGQNPIAAVDPVAAVTAFAECVAATEPSLPTATDVDAATADEDTGRSGALSLLANSYNRGDERHSTDSE